jgi:phage tail-like protein
MTIGLAGDLVVIPGGNATPIHIRHDGAYTRRGLMVGGPFANPSGTSDPMHLLRSTFEALADGAHFQCFVCARTDRTPPQYDLAGAQPFPSPEWTAVAPDAPGTVFDGAPFDFVWVGVELTSEGSASPGLSQMRLDFAHPTYLEHLPATYQDNPASRRLLAQWLTLFESSFDLVHEEVEGLAAMFDPAATDAHFLDWLASWIGCDLSAEWPVARQRDVVAHAFARYATSGTVQALRDAVRAETGVEVVVEEPVNQTSWWVLPADDGADDHVAAMSILGDATVLAVGEAYSATLGTTAVIDQSFIAGDTDDMRPLFSDVAHQYTARIYRGRTYSDQVRAGVEAVLDREQPAHTLHHVCIVEPTMRIGIQARVGVDAIVAGEPEPTMLTDDGAAVLVLGGAPAGRLGDGTRVGHAHIGS